MAHMEQVQTRTYAYRWTILLAFMAAAAVNQMLWITFAAITDSATAFYGVTSLEIGLLSVSFMVVYIFVSIPASWVIDTYGFRVAVGIGAGLTGVFGLLRGLLAQDYTLVLISQIGIAAGQPFILNAVTKVAARWFPAEERATASGFGTLGAYLGIVAGLALTPYLAAQDGIGGMLLIYGIIAVLAAAVFLVVAREHPPIPPGLAGPSETALALDGLTEILRKVDFVLLMVVFFVGLGVFNGVTTWIEEIVKPRGFSAAQAGISGGLMIVGGIAGAVVVPALSDHFRKRVPFIVIALAGAILGLAGITYATQYWLLLASAIALGFFLLSSGPVGFQYGAEIAYPVPEGMSNGLILMMGQISGILFIFGMDSLRSPGTGSMTPALLLLIGLMLAGLLIGTRLKEPGRAR